jgi:hypothetical protein
MLGLLVTAPTTATTGSSSMTSAARRETTGTHMIGPGTLVLYQAKVK